MLYEKNKISVGESKFTDNYMILYTTVNIVKLLESASDYEEDYMTQKILDVTLMELFKSVLKMDNGLWN
jgi:hypothetical protein